MNNDPPTLESLMFRWDDAYVFAYARDRWIAIRRDGLRFLAAGTLTQLETEIESDYGKNPVLYERDALDAARSYLTADHGSPPECTEDLLTLAVRAAEAAVHTHSPHQYRRKAEARRKRHPQGAAHVAANNS